MPLKVGRDGALLWRRVDNIDRVGRQFRKPLIPFGLVMTRRRTSR
jgi:hypothetical protein